MQLSPELQAKVMIWRRKAIEGTITDEEMREAVDILRQGRLTAAQSAAASSSRTKAKAKAIVSADSILDELKGL